MKFASHAAAVEGDLPRSLTRLAEAAEADVGPGPIDLVVTFVTSHFEDEVEAVGRLLRQRFPESRVVGGTAEGVIGGEIEIERIPAAALCLARLPGVNLRPFRLDAEHFASVEQIRGCAAAAGADAGSEPSFLLLGDPYTVPAAHLLGSFNSIYPRRPVFGGMISGCEQPGQSRLLLDGEVYQDGAVGLAFSGALQIHTVVSQGCRPIGEHFVITRCHRNLIMELGGRPALSRLKDVLEGLDPEDMRLAQQAIFVGRVIDEHKDHFVRGDFLVRNLLGIDPQSGAIAVGDEVRLGTTIQFHVRDGDTADEDLRGLLGGQSASVPPAGVFLFSCNGRGTRMWSRPNHDIAVLHEVLGDVPTVGFFAAGEFGAVGGRNFIHGHTASIALFRPAC